jgi:hypothetical protein
MDPRYDPEGAHGRVGGPWAPQAGAYGPPPGTGAADDVLIRLGGWVLAGLAVALLAAVAVLTAGALYGLATWRRWRWWVVGMAGLAGLVLVVALSGPEAALERHLLALRELTDPGRAPVGELVSDRWPAWLLAQAPLALPLGAILAGFARHQVCHVVAHELSPRARRRREAEDRAQLKRARRRATAAPASTKHGPVLGAWIGGDLGPWKAGPWCVLPESALGLGTLLLGLPGSGKTETLLRLSQLALQGGYDVHVIDAKGDQETQARFAALAGALGVEGRLFPESAYDGFRGEPSAIRNRLARVIDYSEPYYEDGARDLLAAVVKGAAGPPRSLAALLTALPALTLEGLDPAVRRGTLARYRGFAAAAARGLDGDWAFEDTRASYILLDGVALGDDAPRLARFFVEDFVHYAAVRKDPDRRALLLIDEFSALRLSNAAPLFERLRSFGVGVVLAAQSVEGLHDDESERERLVNAASALVCHRLANPDSVVARAGTLRRAERSHQLDGAGPTGAGSLRIQDAYRADPNELRSLATGVAYVISGGRAAKVAVARTRTGEMETLPPVSPPTGATGRRSEIVGPGDPALHPTRTGGSCGDPGALGRVGNGAGEGVGASVGEGSGETPTVSPHEDEVPARVASPYAEGL